MIAKLRSRMERTSSLLCIGLDSQVEVLPKNFQNVSLPQFEYNKWLIEQTHTWAVAYKPNMAFYEARGSQGWQELELTIEYLRQQHPDIFTICDAKRADIGSTNKAYATAIFDHLGFDAITLHPYVGKEALAPFLERTDKVSIILCHTSNPGAGEFQDLSAGELPLWQVVAHNVATHWNTHNNCMLVMGATYPNQLKQARSLVGDLPFLVPGVGAQGGSLAEVLHNGTGTNWPALVVSVSRDIMQSHNPADTAQALWQAMQRSYGKTDRIIT